MRFTQLALGFLPLSPRQLDCVRNSATHVPSFSFFYSQPASKTPGAFFFSSRRVFDAASIFFPLFPNWASTSHPSFFSHSPLLWKSRVSYTGRPKPNITRAPSSQAVASGRCVSFFSFPRLTPFANTKRVSIFFFPKSLETSMPYPFSFFFFSRPCNEFGYKAPLFSNDFGLANGILAPCVLFPPFIFHASYED